MREGFGIIQSTARFRRRHRKHKENVLQPDIQSAKMDSRKVVFIMAIKSSNVAARVEPEIKEEAEAILAQLGISASNGINMFYRQIILWRGLPFRPSLPASRPLSLDEMTKEEFNAKMARGLAQAKAGEGVPADEFFASLRQEILESYV